MPLITADAVATTAAVAATLSNRIAKLTFPIVEMVGLIADAVKQGGGVAIPCRLIFKICGEHCNYTYNNYLQKLIFYLKGMI